MFKLAEKKAPNPNSKYVKIVEEIKTSENPQQEFHKLFGSFVTELDDLLYHETMFYLTHYKHSSMGNVSFNRNYIPDSKNNLIAFPLDILIELSPINLKIDDIVKVIWIEDRKSIKLFFGRVMKFLTDNKMIEINFLFNDSKFEFHVNSIFSKLGEVISIDDPQWTKLMNLHGYNKDHLIKILNDKIVDLGKTDFKYKEVAQKELSRRLDIIKQLD